MTTTRISSHKQDITIGFDSPFCVIGERINPTGRKLLAAEMAAGDFSRVSADAVAQVEAGANVVKCQTMRQAQEAANIRPREYIHCQGRVLTPHAVDKASCMTAGMNSRIRLITELRELC